MAPSTLIPADLTAEQLANRQDAALLLRLLDDLRRAVAGMHGRPVAAHIGLPIQSAMRAATEAIGRVRLTP